MTTENSPTDTRPMGNTPVSDAASIDAPATGHDFASNADFVTGTDAPRRDYGTAGNEPGMFDDEGDDDEDLSSTTSSDEDDDIEDDDAESDDEDDDELHDDATDYNPVENRPRDDQYAPVE